MRAADCLLIVTDHNIFKHVNLREIVSRMNKNPIVVDGRGIIDYSQVKELDARFYGAGRAWSKATNTSNAGKP